MTAYLPPDVALWLKQSADKKGGSMSALARDALLRKYRAAAHDQKFQCLECDEVFTIPKQVVKKYGAGGRCRRCRGEAIPI